MNVSQTTSTSTSQAKPRRSTRRWLWLLLVIPVVLLGWGGQAWLNGGSTVSADGSTAAEWYRVGRNSFDQIVMASGELEARRQVEVKVEVNVRTTISEIVEEGTAVETGDIIAVLEDTELRQRIETAMLDLERARADKIAAEQAMEIKVNEAESDRRAAELKLNLAQLDLAKWEQGDLPRERRNLKLALDKARRNVIRFKRDFELSQQLYEEKFISLGELEDDEIRVIEAENELATAELAITIFEEYTYPKDRQKFMSDVDQAKAELERTIRRNESELARSEADLISRTRTLRIRQESYDDLQRQLAACTIRAPQDGLVVYGTSVGHRFRRGDPIAPGRQVRFNETLVLLPDTRQMVAALRVHEAMLPQVRENQQVTVTIDAQPDHPVEGRVLSIAVMAEDGGWVNPDLREYVVRVELPPMPDGHLKPAMRASGQIRTGRVEDAIAVPVQAVFAEGRQRFVYSPAGPGRVGRTPVRIGRASETMVEIVEGLSEGDRVLLRRPRAGELLETPSPT